MVNTNSKPLWLFYIAERMVLKWHYSNNYNKTILQKFHPDKEIFGIYKGKKWFRVADSHQYTL